MKTTTKVLLVFVIATILGGGFGILMTLSTSNASVPDNNDNVIQAEGCTIKVIGSYNTLDVFNKYTYPQSIYNEYSENVLKHCVYIDDANEHSFEAYRSRYDTGYLFIFQFTSYTGAPDSFEFYASSGHEYEIDFWLWSQVTGTYTVTVELYVK